MKRFLDSLEIINKINSLGLVESGSDAGYSVSEMLTSFFVSVWPEANRFAHTSILQYDKVLQRIFRLNRAPSNDTYRRLFHKFDFELTINAFFELYSWMFSQLKLEN